MPVHKYKKKTKQKQGPKELRFRSYDLSWHVSNYMYNKSTHRSLIL